MENLWPRMRPVDQPLVEELGRRFSGELDQQMGQAMDSMSLNDAVDDEDEEEAGLSGSESDDEGDGREATPAGDAASASGAELGGIRSFGSAQSEGDAGPGFRADLVQPATRDVRGAVYKAFGVHIVGPLGGCPGGMRLWALAVPLYIMCGGEWLATLIERMIVAFPELTHIWSWMPLWLRVYGAAIGIVLMEAHVVMAEAAVPPRAGRSPTRSGKFLHALLRMRVSESAEQRIRARVRHSRLAGVVVLALFLVLGRGRMYLEWIADQEEDGVTSDWDVAVASVSVVTTLPTVNMFIGWVLFLQIPTTIVCDDIERSTAWVRRLGLRKNRGRSVNWDAVMGHVQRANDSTTRLSALLAPTIKSFMIIVLSGIVNFMIFTVLPRPANIYVKPISWATFLGTLGFYALSLWMLFAGARATTACEQLVDAVSRLRRWEPDSGRDGRAGAPNPLAEGEDQKAWVMEKPENLVRIEGIRWYCMELNRGQGLGFTYSDRKVTAEALFRLIVRGAVALVATYVIILLTVQHVALPAGNATAAAGGAGGMGG